ncbi:uncharacterized protein LOC34619098, partial [Cyclospora cayetanensis]|uniref:Uncharacterized protein LOC34619098 n=1 Tax=Cyclospora cayetanensis TaxID=88456 RepID=A0A6P6S2Y8_9EIME
RLIEVCIQLLTIVALCAFAVSAGVIVGAVMTRSTLTPGMFLVSVTAFEKEPFAEFLSLDASGGASTTPTSTTAVFRAQFVVTLALSNKISIRSGVALCASGAFIESLGLFLELLYLPAGVMPTADNCYSETGAFSTELSLQPSEQYPSPTAAGDLVRRGRQNASLIKRAGVETGVQDGDTDDSSGTQGDPASASRLVHVVLFRADKRLQQLLQYDANKAQSHPAVGPTQLILNSVPFIPGLRRGTDKVCLYVGINLPLEAADSALKESIKRDCEDRNRVFFQLRAPAASASSMFTRLWHKPFAFGLFSVPCTAQTVAAGDWPPKIRESFIRQKDAYVLEMTILSMESGHN